MNTRSCDVLGAPPDARGALLDASQEPARIDFDTSPDGRPLIEQVVDLKFTDVAHNALLMCSLGNGGAHLASAIGGPKA